MSSTWIDMPVENAREVAQRLCNDLFTQWGFGSGDYWQDGDTLTYEADCEVLLKYQELTDMFYNPLVYKNYVYIGYLSLAIDNSTENELRLGLTADDNDFVWTVDAQSVSIKDLHNFPVCFNRITALPAHPNISFIGYKLTH